MTNSRQNTLIIGGVLVLAGGALAGLIIRTNLTEQTTTVLAGTVGTVIGGLIGFLTRGSIDKAKPAPEDTESH